MHQWARKITTNLKIPHNPKKGVLIRYRLRMMKRMVMDKSPNPLKIIQKDLKTILLQQPSKSLQMIVRILLPIRLVNHLRFNKRSRKSLPKRRHSRPLREIGNSWNPSQISRLNHIRLSNRKVILIFVRKMTRRNRRARECRSHS